jgi:hypothetical protein
MLGFNQHLPFKHLPSLDLNCVDLPQLLAISSIGALYCFEREHANKLHSLSVDLLSQVNGIDLLLIIRC